ncbi:hypothetical protein, partial [Stenotrophomonas maltophilia]|uniref:hypothetical protein n=1 Tax=Stenotrophomonas maltophilia TaxID=40324 RepID=UPI0021C8CA39
ARPAVLRIEPACSGLAPSGLVLAFPCRLRGTARSARPGAPPDQVAIATRSPWPSLASASDVAK